MTVDKQEPFLTIDTIRKYLKNRREEYSSNTICLLFDLTYACNLGCRGCGVNARILKDHSSPLPTELSTLQVRCILDHLADSLDKSPYDNLNLCFGGGECLLRSDISEILKHAADTFGRSCVSLDTNALLLTSKMLDKVGPYIHLVECGCEGTMEIHNDWRNPGMCFSENNVFDCMVTSIKHALSWNNQELDIEILYLPIKSSICSFDDLLKIWLDLGVRSISVHRCMPTGRMAAFPDLIPSFDDYMQILEKALKRKSSLFFNFHLHHSIENILSQLLLGISLPRSYNPLCPMWRSSFAIDALGNIHFCPWAVCSPLADLNLGQAIEFDFLKVFMNYDTSNSIGHDHDIIGCPVPFLLNSPYSELSQKICRYAMAQDPLINQARQFWRLG